METATTHESDLTEEPEVEFGAGSEDVTSRGQFPEALHTIGEPIAILNRRLGDEEKEMWVLAF